MNRRVFLLGTCAACSGMTQPAPRARPEPKRPRAPGVPTSGVRDNTLFESQVRASPLALRGDVLVQSAAGELRAWNAMTLRRTDTWALPHRHFCFVQDGTLVALGFGQVGTTIHRIANGAPARRADEVYASAGEHVYLVRGSRTPVRARGTATSWSGSATGGSSASPGTAACACSMPAPAPRIPRRAGG